MLKVRKRRAPFQSPVFFRGFVLSWDGMRRTCVVMLLVLTGAVAGAQVDSTGGRRSWTAEIGRDAGTFWRGFLHVGSAPARWGADDWAAAGAVAGLTGAAMLADRSADRLAGSLEGRTGDRIEPVVRMYGEVWLLAGVCGGAYIAGLAGGDDWLRETAFLAGTGLVLTAAATTLLKVVVGRARPYHGGGPGTFRMFSLADAYNSFPSGHTAAAFALSAVLAHRLRNAWATAGLYALATLTSVSRIYVHDHWFSDCVFGALLSTAITHTFLRWYDGQKEGMRTDGLRVEPTAGGVRIVYAF